MNTNSVQANAQATTGSTRTNLRCRAKVDEGPGVGGGQPDGVAGLEVAVHPPRLVQALQLLRHMHHDLHIACISHRAVTSR